MDYKTPSIQRWIILAIASGACAALNGVFAKLTTASLTSSWARQLASLLRMPAYERILEYAIRIAMLSLNTIFNGVMWGLFTRGLALSPSTIRVNVINTSSNFLITAVLGALLFRESLPAMWFVGASLLVTGSIIIGASQEGDASGSSRSQANLETSKVEGQSDKPSTNDETSGEKNDESSYTMLRKRNKHARS